MAAAPLIHLTGRAVIKGLSKASKYFRDKKDKIVYERRQKEHDKRMNTVAARRRKEKADAEIKAYNDKFKPDAKFKKSKEYKEFVKSIHNKYEPKKYFD
tara:strand:- start:150 stop:446 length:297 start_codon:yes stop_codon:yes gene_type:complete